MSDIFGILSGFILYIFFTKYIPKIRSRKVIPNLTTLIIWFIITALNFITFFFVVEKNFVICFQLLIGVGGSIAVIHSSVTKGKFSKINLNDGACIFIAATSIILWQTTGSASVANLYLQVANVISYFPLLRGLKKGTNTEDPLIWLIATPAIILLILSIITARCNWVALMFPLTRLIGNTAIIILANNQLPPKRTLHQSS